MKRNDKCSWRRAAWRALLIAAAVSLTAGTVAAQSWQSVGGGAYAGWVKTALTEQWVSAVTLPTGGGSVSTDALNTSVTGMLSARTTSAVTSGSLSPDLAGVSSVASAADVNVMNGLITARRVIALATLSQDRNKLTADAFGSSVSGLMVNGVAYGSDDAPPAANTRVDLPGVGYVILNEQSTAKGRGTVFTVNMIHVVMLDQTTGAKTGDIVVASATAADQ